MALYSWLTAISADWLTAADWGGAVPNDPTADAVIAVAGAYSVGIAAAETITVDSVTLNDASGSLAVAGVLTLGGTQALLSLQRGVLALTGTVRGGTLSLAGGVLAGNGGTLDGVHVRGTLAPGRFAPVNAINSLVVQTTLGAAGSIDLTGGALSVLSSLTLDQVAISLASPYGALRAPAGGTLTLGPAATFGMAGGSVPNAGASVLANQGTMTLGPDLQGGGDTINPTLINSGAINLFGASQTQSQVVFGAGVSNSGLITVGTSVALRLIGAATAFTNTGTVAVAAGATFEIDQNTTLAGLAGGVTSQGGQLLLRSGTLALGGGTLDVATTGPFFNLAILGTVQGGVILPDGGTLVLPGATLDGISLTGTLDLSAGSALNSSGFAGAAASGYTVTVKNGLTAIGPTTLNLTGDTLNFLDSRTLDNITIAIGQPLPNFSLRVPTSGLTVAAAGTLTLGPTTAVTTTGAAYVSAGALVNNGTLTVGPPSNLTPALSFGSTALINAGIVGIGAAGLLSVTTLNNSGSITLAPTATLELDAVATLPQVVASLGAVTTNGGLLVLGGTVDARGGTLSVGTSGVLANLKLTGSLKNGSLAQAGGTLALVGGTLDGVTVLGSLDLSVGKSVAIRNGVAVQAAAGPGVINLSGGVLTVLDGETLTNVAISLGQPGTPANPVPLNIAGGGTLTLGASAMVTATGNATLNLGGFTNLGTDAVGATRQEWDGQSIVNAGLVTLAGGTFTLGGIVSSVNSGSIVSSGTAALNPNATISNTGLLQATGGTLTVGQNLSNFNGSSLVGGSYEADAGATMVLARTGTLGFDAATITLNGVGSGLVTPTGTLNNTRSLEQSLTSITAAGRLSVLGGRGYATTLSISDAGLLQLGGGTFSAAGVTVTSTGALRGFGAVTGNLSDAGTVDASGGLLSLGAVTGAGGLRVEPGSTLEIGAASATTLFNFTGGALMLDAPSGYSGALSNFAPNDTLILKSTNASGASVTGTSLSVTLAAGGTLQYALVNPQPNIGATVTIDGSGNADVTLTPPPAGACFLQGTGILTARGEVAVEHLAAGDQVVSLLGQRLARVIWVGHSRVRGDRHPRPWDVHPVRVQAGAFGVGRPHRTLFLSPDHAVFVDGVLVPIRYLLNGASVAQVAMDAIAYWHVELDRHDVLAADGLACESYLDTGNRGVFGGEFATLHADFSRGVWAAAGCAPLVTCGAGVAGVRRMLLGEAERLGHGMTSEPGLRLEGADGVLAGRLEGDVWRFDLPSGIGRVRLVSRVTAAGDFDVHSEDRRRLGVAVAEMTLDGVAVGADRLGSGWHAAEAGWRWTDGAGEVDAGGASALVVRLVGLGRYWLPNRNEMAVVGRGAGQAIFS